ncbi:MAG: hypothetical protein M3161_03635 [Actinomycetota bacterium]|nr:hypothetical protein [Actinomycetota bacterium]
MTAVKRIDVVAVGSLAVLLIAGLAPTHGLAAAKKCGAYKPAPPSSASANAATAADSEVHAVTEKNTEKNPLVVEYHQDPGLWTIDGSSALVDTSTFHNFQLATKTKIAVLNVRAEFRYPTTSDLDFYLFDRLGNEVGASASFSPLPALNPDNGGEGYEQIPAIAGARCEGFTLESRPYISPTGEDVTLKVWVD